MTPPQNNDLRSKPSLQTIVIVNDNAKVTGGADKIALTSAVELAARGFRIILLTAVGPVPEELSAIPNLTVICTDQYDLLGDPNRLRVAVQGIWNTKSSRIATELFESLHPGTTIVHIHLWAKALSSSVVEAALDRGLSVVITMHDYLLACPTGTFFIHPQQRICPLEPMSLPCIRCNCDTRHYADKAWRLVRQTVQNHVGGMPSRMRHFIAISDLNRSKMSRYLPSDATIYQVSNFVEAKYGAPALVAEHEKFVYTGRLVKEKGPALFAEAALRAGVQATFIGEGDERASVQRCNPQAEITGWVTPAVAMSTLRNARALVFPSLWYEAQPLVILEALAIGMPCIIADTSAAREMIVDGETGLLFRSGNIDELVEKIAMLKDPELAARLGRNAFERYWTNPCTVERHLDDLERVYRQMLAENASSREVLQEVSVISHG